MDKFKKKKIGECDGFIKLLWLFFKIFKIEFF